MKYRLQGRSGLRVSEVLWVPWRWARMGWGETKDGARKVYETCREAEGNFIDTANVYTNGSSERFLGEFIKVHRQSTVLATKYLHCHAGKQPQRGGQSSQEHDSSRGGEREALANRLLPGPVHCLLFSIHFALASLLL